MKIDLKEIRKIIEEQRKRAEKDRGLQPLIVLECFMDSYRNTKEKIGDDERCKTCEFYFWKCGLYLSAFEINEEIFRRDK